MFTSSMWLKKGAVKVLGSYRYDLLRYLLAHGRLPQIKKPITFNDKIARRKLGQLDPQYPILASKLLVRDFISQKLGSDILTKLYFTGNNVTAIQLADLPRSFVVKAAHGSGADYLFFIKNKEQITLKTLQQRAMQLLDKRYGILTNEKWYTLAEPAILIEEMLVDERFDVPLDYKLFVFDGRVHFIQVDYARFSRHTRTIYDTNWQPQPFTFKYPQGPISFRPALLPEMIQIAETLGEGFDFVRIDLYCLNDDRIVFGEITLAPEASWGQFKPKLWDYELGKLWPEKQQCLLTL